MNAWMFSKQPLYIFRAMTMVLLEENIQPLQTESSYLR